MPSTTATVAGLAFVAIAAGATAIGAGPLSAGASRGAADGPAPLTYEFTLPASEFDGRSVVATGINQDEPEALRVTIRAEWIGGPVDGIVATHQIFARLASGDDGQTGAVGLFAGPAGRYQGVDPAVAATATAIIPDDGGAFPFSVLRLEWDNTALDGNGLPIDGDGWHVVVTLEEIDQ